MDDDYPFIRQLRSPVDRFQLRPLDPRCQVVQFAEPLADEDFERVSSFIKDYPEVSFRVYGHYSGLRDLSFLKWFSFVRNFQADVYLLESLSGLEYLPDEMNFFALGSTKKRFSLTFLERFETLSDLYLEGHSKDIGTLSSLLNLRCLSLRSITLPDLSVLTPLQNLRSFKLKLGGTNNLELLDELRALRYLELWLIRGLSDISSIANLTDLRYLFLQSLKHVDRLPTFAKLSKLERVHIEGLKALFDLRPVADAPNLKQLNLGDMRHLKLENLACLKGHPTLEEVGIGLCSRRRNEEAERFMNLRRTKLPEPISHYVDSEN